LLISVTNVREIWLKLIANARAVPRSISLQSLRTILPSRIKGSSKRAVFSFGAIENVSRLACQT